MSSATGVGLPEALERAASALSKDADRIRPANGDPFRLRELLDEAAAVRVLSWLLEHEPEAGGELASEWADEADSDPAPLLAIDPDGLPKAARKALRRVHHRLRSRGVEIAVPRSEAVVAKLARVDEELSSAVVTPVDPRGAQMAYLVEPIPSGGTRIFEVLIDGERGIGGFEIYSAAQGKVKRFLQKLTRSSERPAVDADPAAVRALIARAASHQPENRAAPRGFSEWRTRVTNRPDGTPTPGESAREAIGSVDASALGLALELIRARDVGPWPPENPLLQATAEKLLDLEKDERASDESALRAQIDAILDEAVPALYAQPFADRCAERFEETAYVFEQWQRGEEARACIAAADAFRERAPGAHPVGRALLEVLLTPAIRRLEAAPDREEG